MLQLYSLRRRVARGAAASHSQKYPPTHTPDAPSYRHVSSHQCLAPCYPRCHLCVPLPFVMQGTHGVTPVCTCGLDQLLRLVCAHYPWGVAMVAQTHACLTAAAALRKALHLQPGPVPFIRVDVYFPPKVPTFLSPYFSLPYCISLEISREITGIPLVRRTRLM